MHILNKKYFGMIFLSCTVGLGAQAATEAGSSANFDPQASITDDGKCATAPESCDPATKLQRAIDKHKAALDAQLQRIGMGFLHGKIDGPESEQLRQAREEMDQKLKDSMADGKLTTAEREQLAEMRKKASKGIFLAKSSEVDLFKRAALMRKQLEVGLKNKSISEAEAALINTQIKKYEDAAVAAQEGGVSEEERLALLKESNGIFQTMAYYGLKSKKQWKKMNNELVNALGNDIGSRIGQCWQEGNLSDEERDLLYAQMDEWFALNQKYQMESQEEKDKLDKLDKKDKKDLKKKLDELNKTIQKACSDDKKETPPGTPPESTSGSSGASSAQ